MRVLAQYRRRLATAGLLAAGLAFGRHSAHAKGLAFERLAEGLERRTFRWQSAQGMPVRVHAFRVDTRIWRFRAVRAPAGGRDTVHAMARREGLALAVNASFFDQRGRPLGLIVDRGRQIQPVRKVDWGVFFADRAGRARIVHARDYRQSPEIDVAVQSGPRLVVSGRVLDLRPQLGRRTAVCVEDSGRVLLVVTEQGVLLQDFAELLARSPGKGGLGCRDALNLDGGKSTQATLFLPGALWDLYGGALIPVVLGVQPRQRGQGVPGHE